MIEEKAEVLPVTLVVPLDSSEEIKSQTSEIIQSFKVILHRSFPLKRQIQLLLYQTKLFTSLDALLSPENTDDDPVASAQDSKRFSLFFGETDL
jgi:hypothetical protein